MGNVSNIRDFFTVSKDKFVTTRDNTLRIVNIVPSPRLKQPPTTRGNEKLINNIFQIIPVITKTIISGVLNNNIIKKPLTPMYLTPMEIKTNIHIVIVLTHKD